MSNIGNKQTMAKNLRYFLEKTGKTQKELAEVVGVAPSTFNDWMKAKKYPRIDKIEILANYFGILKSDLIEEKTEERMDVIKKADIISDVVLRMKNDSDFEVLIERIIQMDSKQVHRLLAFLDAFSK